MYKRFQVRRCQVLAAKKHEDRLGGNNCGQSSDESTIWVWMWKMNNFDMRSVQVMYVQGINL